MTSSLHKIARELLPALATRCSKTLTKRNSEALVKDAYILAYAYEKVTAHFLFEEDDFIEKLKNGTLNDEP
jgi:hypothetical protein